jgi:hypothetical protein
VPADSLPEATGGVSPEMLKLAIRAGVDPEQRDGAALLSAIARLEEDAARLDWLGAQLNCVVTMKVADPALGDCYLDFALHGTDQTIREAIDEYRRASRTEEASR